MKSFLKVKKAHCGHYVKDSEPDNAVEGQMIHTVHQEQDKYTGVFVYTPVIKKMFVPIVLCPGCRVSATKPSSIDSDWEIKE